MADTAKPAETAKPAATTTTTTTTETTPDAPKPAAGAAPAGNSGTPQGTTPAGETPSGDGTKKDGEGEKQTPAAAAVPDKYDLKVPEGAEQWLEASDLETVAKIAKANGWTNEEAQAHLEEHTDRLVAQSDQFRAMTEADPELGGDKLEETQRLASRGLDRIRPKTHARSEAFRKLLTKSGWGNHPEVVAFLADIGRQTKEDSPAATGGTPPAEKKTRAEKFYGRP